MTEHTGYATVSGFHEFLYEPEKPLHGDITDWAYNQRGCIAYVIELWDLFKQIGMERKKPFVDHYVQLERKDFHALAKLDRERNQGRVFKRWRKVSHPQLGEVEVGGFDGRVGIWNPPYEELAETCATQSAAFLRVAALVPLVSARGGQAGEGRRGPHAHRDCAWPTAATSAPTGSRRRGSFPHLRAPAAHHRGRGREARRPRGSRSSRSVTSTAGGRGSTTAPASSCPGRAATCTRSS